jgi:hypothetical protein
VPRRGRVPPPSKVTEPPVRPSKCPRIDRTVDFPALHNKDQYVGPLYHWRGPHPFDPSNTKIPNLGMRKVRSDIAVTTPFLRPHRDVEKVFSKFLIYIAVSGGQVIEVSSAGVRFRQKAQEDFFASWASYSLRSSRTAT